MSILDLSRINLNLLTCLQALLEEQSVTLAAEKLCLSQSAVSKNLAQLRQITQDPLFTRTAHGLLPTTRAIQLQRELGPLLDNLWQLVQPQQFDPLRSQRLFRLSLPETTSRLLFQGELPQILASAPGIQFNINNLSMDCSSLLNQGKLDLAVIPHDLDCGQKTVSGLHCRRLHSDSLTCLLREDHPALSQEWSLENWLRLGHISLSSVTLGQSSVDVALEEIGKRRHFAVAVDDFHTATTVCEQSDLCIVTTRNWADYAACRFQVVPKPLPLQVEPITYELYWHERSHKDPAHQWLRNLVREATTGNAQ